MSEEARRRALTGAAAVSFLAYLLFSQAVRQTAAEFVRLIRVYGLGN